jgi:hypothetical protein
MITYEQQLKRDSDWAKLERERYLQQQSAVHITMRRFVSELHKRGIDYAVAGELCLFSHGLKRFADALEILVTPEGLNQIHEDLVGKGYVGSAETDSSILDVENGVRIKFLISGEYPGKESL